MNNQYDKMSLADLKETAKAKGIKNISTLRKQELIDMLNKFEENNSTLQGNEQNIGKDVNSKNLMDERKLEEVNNTEDKKVEDNTFEDKKIEEKKLEAKKDEDKKDENKTLEDKKIQSKDVINNNEGKRYNEYRNDNEFKNNKDNNNDMKDTEHKISDIKNPSDIKYNDEKADNIKSYTENKNRTFINYNNDMKKDIQTENRKTNYIPTDMDQLDSGETKEGILEVLPDGYGFIRCDNFLPGENDVYVSPAQIRRFNLKTGDIVAGNTRIRNQNEKFSALLYVKLVNGFHPAEAAKRKKFEDLTPVFPNERIHLETPGASVAMRMVDLISPIGKGQRGMIVSQPKTGKTTLLKQVAKAITKNHPDMSLIILLIDERPEEVTDIKESIEGKNVEVIYSTFDELPENHKRVSEMVIERAKRLVEHKKDVVILLDSITRLARAYNLTVQASGRTLSGGLDPAALHMPKKFFGAARNMREGGSLTILATALVDTGSRMDDVVFEEFKGTGNMELVLDRSLSEKRIFPAIDLAKSSTRRDDLLLSSSEMEASFLMHKALNGMKSDDALEKIIELFIRTKTNNEFIETIKKTKI